VSSLLDPKLSNDFVDEVKLEYEELRAEHYASLKDRKFVPLDIARSKKLKINWTARAAPVAPSFLGTKVTIHYTTLH
jgi:5-methyltetrahydrofolate--homocysteine methyltransferase